MVQGKTFIRTTVLQIQPASGQPFGSIVKESLSTDEYFPSLYSNVATGTTLVHLCLFKII